MVKQKKLLLRCIDDSVIIMAFVLDDGYYVKREGTPDEISAEIARASEGFPPDRLPIIGWKEIREDEVLLDRTFRDAWTTQGDKIEHNMAKARNIHRENMRRARAGKLDALDAEYMMADEAGDQQKKREVAVKKQALRDVTALPEIETAQTVEELKAIWPDELGGRYPA